MTTARSVISTALGVHLNRLAPGETLDPDTAARCLEALNDLMDEFNGGKDFLFREILTTSTPITGTYGTLGVDWVGISAGDLIFGATVRYAANLDVPMEPISVAQYANIAIKTTTTYPAFYAQDGQAKVFLYPSAQSHVITIRTRQVMSEFADIETDYEMPKGYRSAMAAMLAERVAPSLLGKIPADVQTAASAARSRLAVQAIEPAVLGGADMGSSRVARIRRGY